MTHKPGEDEAETRSEELSVKTLGQLLREARDSKQVSLEKVAEELRIELRVLQALESDRLDDLAAAPVFVKGYIKQYGRQIGLDYAPLYEAYQRQVSRDDVDLRPNRAIALRDERQITVWIVAALVLALILVFLFVWWLGDRDEVAVLGTRTPAPVSAPGRSSAPLLRQPAATAAPVDAPVAETTAPVPPVAGTSGAASPEVREVVEAAVATAAPTAVDAVPSPAAPVPRAEGSLALRLTFTTESWVEVTDARGEQLMYDLADAGSTVELYPVPPARVLLGNAEGVDVTVDGRAFAIPSQGRRGNLANFVIRSQD